MNNHEDILDDIIKNHLASLNVYISKDFIDPESQSEKQADFPYVTFLLSDFAMEENSLRISQNIDVFGFVKSHDELGYKRADLMVKVATALKGRIVLNAGSISNLFSPFGLRSFLDPPYGGFRLSGTVNFDLRQATASTITVQAANWLLLNGSQFEFLNGNTAQFLGTP